MSPAPVAPPTLQEIERKLSVHSVSRPKNTNLSLGPVSGTESDSDSIFTPDIYTPTGAYGFHFGTSPSQPPLSAIAERASISAEDTEDEDDTGEGGWKAADVRSPIPNPSDETVLKAGYLWKKGERRKTWKKRWFVLRPAHLAYYKTSKEYQLLRLLELTDIRSCTLVNLKRHDHAFGLICSSRTYYLQASNAQEVQEWVKAIEDARQSLLATSTQTSVATPIAIAPPDTVIRSISRETPGLSSSPQQTSRRLHAFTSSDSDDGLNPQHERAMSIPSTQALQTSPVSKASQKDTTKVILSGYLMKCGSKRRNWRKRWFVLTGEKLIYYGSHMDPKPHRSFQFNEILDAFECDLQTHKQTSVPSSPSQGTDGDDMSGSHTFKIVTTKRSLLLCAPSEDEEIKWLGAIRALIARRTESGLVPGKISKARPPPENGKEAEGGGGGSGGLKNKARRLSGSGGHHGEHEWKGT